jgi:hypothetical protein
MGKWIKTDCSQKNYKWLINMWKIFSTSSAIRVMQIKSALSSSPQSECLPLWKQTTTNLDFNPLSDE